jgi:hypothetical protein
VGGFADPGLAVPVLALAIGGLGIRPERVRVIPAVPIMTRPFFFREVIGTAPSA